MRVLWRTLPVSTPSGRGWGSLAGDEMGIGIKIVPATGNDARVDFMLDPPRPIHACAALYPSINLLYVN